MCQVGRGGWTAFLSSLPLGSRTAARCDDFPDWRGRQAPPRREDTPKTEGEGAQTFPLAPAQVPGVRNVAPRSGAAVTARARPGLPLPPRSVSGFRGLCPRGGGTGTVNICAAPLFALWRGTGVWRRFDSGPPSGRGARGGGGDGGRRAAGRGARGRPPRSPRPGPGSQDARRRRNRVARAVLCRGEQQRTLMLTDEHRRLPSFPSSHVGPIPVPVFVV